MIHKVKQYTLRAAPLILVCCIFIFILSPSASALYSYEDFISNLEVDGENEIITVTLPIDRTMLQVWNSDWSVIARENDSSVSFYASELAHYHFGIYPMYGDALSVADLPNGSSLTFSYSLYQESVGFQQPTSFGEFTYYNGAGVELRNDRVSGPTQPFDDPYSFTFTLNKPDGADNCTFSLHLGDFMQYYSGRVTLVVKEIKMGISISALYRQQQLTGKTNKLLEEVNKQLAEQGKTMEDVVYGDHGFDSSDSDFSGIGSDLSNSAGQANDAMSAGMDSLGSMMNSDAFSGTLTVLAAGVDAVFTGHDVTICGVTGNPFTLFVSLAAIAIILMLAMKFIFRKWGSGGSDSSGGGTSDA